MAAPQIMTLAHIARHESVAGILGEARQRKPLLIEPHVLTTAEGLTICYPGDEAHPIAERAMPGPLRLTIRSGRYEPEQGFDAFFAEH
jgi:hypothetical protein